MKIINADIAELMFDITPEELIEKTLEAISCGGYPEENRFNTSDYLDLQPNYSFSIFPVVIKNIKANDILSVEALSNEEIEVKINFSNKYVHSQLLYLVSRKKIAEQTISIVFKKINIIGSRHESKIILDDLDLKNLKNTHAILEAAKKEQFKNISEIDFINIIIGKSKKGEPILVHDSDLEKNARLNTIKKNRKKTTLSFKHRTIKPLHK